MPLSVKPYRRLSKSPEDTTLSQFAPAVELSKDEADSIIVARVEGAMQRVPDDAYFAKSQDFRNMLYRWYKYGDKGLYGAEEKDRLAIAQKQNWVEPTRIPRDPASAKAFYDAATTQEERKAFRQEYQDTYDSKQLDDHILAERMPGYGWAKDVAGYVSALDNILIYETSKGNDDPMFDIITRTALGFGRVWDLPFISQPETIKQVSDVIDSQGRDRMGPAVKFMEDLFEKAHIKSYTPQEIEAQEKTYAALGIPSAGPAFWKAMGFLNNLGVGALKLLETPAALYDNPYEFASSLPKIPFHALKNIASAVGMVALENDTFRYYFEKVSGPEWAEKVAEKGDEAVHDIYMDPAGTALGVIMVAQGASSARSFAKETKRAWVEGKAKAEVQKRMDDVGTELDRKNAELASGKRNFSEEPITTDAPGKGQVVELTIQGADRPIYMADRDMADLIAEQYGPSGATVRIISESEMQPHIGPRVGETVGGRVAFTGPEGAFTSHTTYGDIIDAATQSGDPVSVRLAAESMSAPLFERTKVVGDRFANVVFDKVLAEKLGYTWEVNLPEGAITVLSDNPKTGTLVHLGGEHTIQKLLKPEAQQKYRIRADVEKSIRDINKQIDEAEFGGDIHKELLARRKELAAELDFSARRRSSVEVKADIDKQRKSLLSGEPSAREKTLLKIEQLERELASKLSEEIAPEKKASAEASAAKGESPKAGESPSASSKSEPSGEAPTYKVFEQLSGKGRKTGPHPEGRPEGLQPVVRFSAKPSKVVHEILKQAGFGSPKEGTLDYVGKRRYKKKALAEVLKQIDQALANEAANPTKARRAGVGEVIEEVEGIRGKSAKVLEAELLSTFTDQAEGAAVLAEAQKRRKELKLEKRPYRSSLQALINKRRGVESKVVERDLRIRKSEGASKKPTDPLEAEAYELREKVRGMKAAMERKPTSKGYRTHTKKGVPYQDIIARDEVKLAEVEAKIAARGGKPAESVVVEEVRVESVKAKPKPAAKEATAKPTEKPASKPTSKGHGLISPEQAKKMAIEDVKRLATKIGDYLKTEGSSVKAAREKVEAYRDDAVSGGARGDVVAKMDQIIERLKSREAEKNEPPSGKLEEIKLDETTTISRKKSKSVEKVQTGAKASKEGKVKPKQKSPIELRVEVGKSGNAAIDALEVEISKLRSKGGLSEIEQIRNFADELVPVLDELGDNVLRYDRVFDAQKYEMMLKMHAASIKKAMANIPVEMRGKQGFEPTVPINALGIVADVARHIGGIEWTEAMKTRMRNSIPEESFVKISDAIKEVFESIAEGAISDKIKNGIVQDALAVGVGSLREVTSTIRNKRTVAYTEWEKGRPRTATKQEYQQTVKGVGPWLVELKRLVAEAERQTRVYKSDTPGGLSIVELGPDSSYEAKIEKGRVNIEAMRRKITDIESRMATKTKVVQDADGLARLTDTREKVVKALSQLRVKLSQGVTEFKGNDIQALIDRGEARLSGLEKEIRDFGEVASIDGLEYRDMLAEYSSYKKILKQHLDAVERLTAESKSEIGKLHDELRGRRSELDALDAEFLNKANLPEGSQASFEYELRASKIEMEIDKITGRMRAISKVTGVDELLAKIGEEKYKEFEGYVKAIEEERRGSVELSAGLNPGIVYNLLSPYFGYFSRAARRKALREGRTSGGAGVTEIRNALNSDVSTWLEETGSVLTEPTKAPLRERISNFIRRNVDKFHEFPEITRKGNRDDFAYAREELRAGKDSEISGAEYAEKALGHIVGELNPVEYEMFRSTVVLRDLVESANKGEIVPRELDVAEATAAYERLKVLVEKEANVSKAIETHDQIMQNMQDHAILRGYISATSARRAYLPHMVALREGIKQRPLKQPLSKSTVHSFQKKRSGSVLDYSTDYIHAVGIFLAEMHAKISRQDRVLRVASRYDVKPLYEDAAKRQGLDKAEAVPPGYVEWSEKSGIQGIGYRGPADALIDAWIEKAKAGLNKDMIEILEDTKRGEKFWVPYELAKELSNYDKHFSEFSNMDASVALFKEWAINMNPWQYTRRNTLGDLFNVATSIPQAFGPGGLKQLGRAVHDVYRMRRFGEVSTDMRRGIDNSSTSAGPVYTEMTNIKNIDKQFHEMATGGALSNPAKATVKAVGDFFSGARKVPRFVSEMREMSMRLWVDYYVMETYAKTGKFHTGTADVAGLLKDYSKAKEFGDHTMTIDVAGKIASKVSRETLLDYGALSPFEKRYLQRKILPFYAFSRLMIGKVRDSFRGLPNDERLANVMTTSKWQRKTRATLVAMLASQAAWQLYNNMYYPEMEATMSDDERRRFHMWFDFEDENGNEAPYPWTDPTPIAQVFELLGQDVALTSVSDYLSGRKTLEEALGAAAEGVPKGASNAWFQMLNPLPAAVSSAITGEQMFPNVWAPRESEDSPARLFAKAIGLGAPLDVVEEAGRDWFGLDTEYGREFDNLLKEMNPTKKEFLGVRDRDIDRASYMYVVGEVMRANQDAGFKSEGMFTPLSKEKRSFILALSEGDMNEAVQIITKEKQKIADAGGSPEVVYRDFMNGMASRYNFMAKLRKNALYEGQDSSEHKFAARLTGDGVLLGAVDRATKYHTYLIGKANEAFNIAGIR